MTTATHAARHSVFVPGPVATPRGARLVGWLFTKFIASIQESRERRAEQVLANRRADEAAACRAYARRFMDVDPRFAADLLAAADRHERGG